LSTVTVEPQYETVCPLSIHVFPIRWSWMVTGTFAP